MKQNTICTIADVINDIKDKYKSEGEAALYADNNWHIYVADDELSLASVCCITAPPDFDEETDEEIIPQFAAENGMDGSLLPEIIQDVIISALAQKSDLTNEELIKALNYYLSNDNFITF